MTNENVDVAVLLPILRQIPLFAGLDENLHKEIIQHIVLMYYPPEYQIFKENEDGDALYIVKKGKIEIYHDPKEEGELSQKVAEINEGGFFGEMSLVADSPRNASAKTMEESEVFILSKSDFKNLLSSNQNLAEQISATVVDRTNENNQNTQ